MSQNLSSKQTIEIPQPNKTGLIKFAVPTFARVNIDKINKRNKPFNSVVTEKRTQNSATKKTANKRSDEKKEASKMSSSGLLNPLIEQILRDLPTAHPSQLGTGYLFDSQARKNTKNPSQTNLNLTMTAQALLNASNRIAAKSQIAIKEGRKGNVVRLS